MSFYKFEREDIIRSVIKAHPKVTFKIYGGNVYTNIEDAEKMKFSPVSQIPSACSIEGLDFSCPDNSEYIGVI